MARTDEEIVTTSTTISDSGSALEPAVVSPRAASTERTEEVTVDPYAERRDAFYRLQQAIWLIFGFFDGLIAIRFVLRLFGANPAAGFAQFIYGLTAPLLSPFVGLFPSPRFVGSVLEVTSIVAMVVYILLAWLLIQLLSLFFRESRTGVVTRRTDTRIQ